MTITAIALPMEKTAAFCDRWQVTEFALFGSVLRDDSAQRLSLLSFQP